MNKLKIKTLDQATEAAAEFLEKNTGKKVFAFYGQMGAGKTTFIKALCERMKVVDTVNSPTFSIINEYLTKNNDAVFHFDFYRMKGKEEALSIGVEDYFFSGETCFIEWPEIVEEMLPEDYVRVDIIETNKGAREISFT
jgi:tRNA threonylcarbamoyladenosine biosynthesis protein TsaE